MLIYLGQRLLVISSSLPGSHHAANNDCFLFGLAPDGVYQANRVTPVAGELLPHRFNLATRLSTEMNRPFGGLLSVALSLIFRSVGVTDHPVLRSPDFPLVTEVTSEHPIGLNARIVVKQSFHRIVRKVLG